MENVLVVNIQIFRWVLFPGVILSNDSVKCVPTNSPHDWMCMKEKVLLTIIYFSTTHYKGMKKHNTFENCDFCVTFGAKNLTFGNCIYIKIFNKNKDKNIQ